MLQNMSQGEMDVNATRYDIYLARRMGCRMTTVFKEISGLEWDPGQRDVIYW